MLESMPQYYQVLSQSENPRSELVPFLSSIADNQNQTQNIQYVLNAEQPVQTSQVNRCVDVAIFDPWSMEECETTPSFVHH